MTPRTSSPTKRTPSPLDDPPIVRTLRGTLKATEPLYAAQGPVWALCVLAHLVVLLRSATFIDIKLTKCLTALFTLAMKSQKSSVRALGCLVWRAMTWAYFQPPPVRLPRESQDDDEEPQSEADEDLEEDTHAYQRRLTMTWRVIHSVVDMGAGLSTIGALLAKTEDDDNHSTLRRALHVLSLMSKKGGPTCQDALDLACHLMTLGASTNNENREIGEPHEWNPMKLLAPPLFSCSPGLMTAEFKSLAPVVKPIFEYCPQVEDVRWLNEDELSLEWVYDSLIGIWKEGLRALRLFWGCKDLPVSFVPSWSSWDDFS